MAEIALNRQIRLLRVGVNKILRLRISEWLEGQRQWRIAQIVLVKKCGLREIQSYETLLVRKVAECGRGGLIEGCRAGIRAIGHIDRKSLKNRNRIQVSGIPWPTASTGAAKSKLAARGSIRRIAQEVETQQRMVVEDSVGGANHSFTIALRVPRQS